MKTSRSVSLPANLMSIDSSKETFKENKPNLISSGRKIEKTENLNISCNYRMGGFFAKLKSIIKNIFPFNKRKIEIVKTDPKVEQWREKSVNLVPTLYAEHLAKIRDQKQAYQNKKLELKESYYQQKLALKKAVSDSSVQSHSSVSTMTGEASSSSSRSLSSDQGTQTESIKSLSRQHTADEPTLSIKDLGNLQYSDFADASEHLALEAGPSHLALEAGPSHLALEAGPSHLALEASPSHLALEASPSHLALEASPSHLALEASPSHLALEASPSHLALEASPSHLALEASPSHLALEASPSHLALEASPSHLALEASPSHLALEAGPSHLALEASPSHLALEASPSHLALEAGPSHLALEASPRHLALEAGPSHLALEAGPEEGTANLLDKTIELEEPLGLETLFAEEKPSEDGDSLNAIDGEQYRARVALGKKVAQEAANEAQRKATLKAMGDPRDVLAPSQLLRHLANGMAAGHQAGQADRNAPTSPEEPTEESGQGKQQMLMLRDISEQEIRDSRVKAAAEERNVAFNPALGIIPPFRAGRAIRFSKSAAVEMHQ